LRLAGCALRRLQDIPGASVEHNNFCVSAHFRNCATENWQKVVVAVNDSVAAQQAQLHVTRGRKVLEVRPQVRHTCLLFVAC
jgi:trehalose 6-phosphate phosphatase